MGVYLLGILIVKEGSRNGSSLSVGALLGVPAGVGAPLLGIREGYGKEGSEDGHLSPWGSC